MVCIRSTSSETTIIELLQNPLKIKTTSLHTPQLWRLFSTGSGDSETVLAEAIGYEVGKPLKVINCGELLSKWVGESSKNIDSIFAEGRRNDAILVFNEVEGLFGQRRDMRCVCATCV